VEILALLVLALFSGLGWVGGRDLLSAPVEN
jgi:hypothetical protein